MAKGYIVEELRVTGGSMRLRDSLTGELVDVAITPGGAFTPPKLVRCTEELNREMPLLRKRAFSQLIETSRDLRKLEKEGDAIFRDAVSSLFKDPSVDAKVLLREREVLEDLENAIDRCERVAETLALLSVKHG